MLDIDNWIYFFKNSNILTMMGCLLILVSNSDVMDVLFPITKIWRDN